MAQGQVAGKPWTDRPQLVLLALLHPHRQLLPITVVLGGGAVLGALAMLAGMPLWGATVMVLTLLAYPVAQKWQQDLGRWGLPATVVCVLIYLQGFHTIEHITQWVQYHLLQWHPRESSGLISAANAEIVHFGWNWTVFAVELYLLRRGMRGWWAALLVLWTAAHTFEHTYLMLQYLNRLVQLQAEGASPAFAQGLPGILGRGGWFQTGQATQGSFLCSLPLLTTAIRLDVHFWWNIGETALLLPAAHTFLRRLTLAAPVVAKGRKGRSGR